MLEALVAEGDLHPTRDQYHYLGDGAPAGRISLRTSGSETVVIQNDAAAEPNMVGELDLESAPMLVHEGAIYMHQAQTYLVDSLDWDGRIAHVRPVEVDYYTRALVGSTIRRLDAAAERVARPFASPGELLIAHGEVTVITQATGYRKIRRYTQETLGYGPIELPEMRLETTGYWMVFDEALTEELERRGIFLRANDYGPNWQEQRVKVLERDGYRCRTCGAAADDFALHIHHIRPFREYGYIPGVNDAYLRANDVENLVTLCSGCHRRAEAGQQTRSALAGLAYTLRNLAPLFLMCDPTDIEVTAERVNPVTRAPTLVVYERAAAGVGFSERLYELHDDLLAAAAELVADCQCRAGCPACVGPPGEIGPDTKQVTRELLRMLARVPAAGSAAEDDDGRR
jgi:DEAD/DEAH box helicase domain-containing protein